ncbi:MAG: hypothetical protein HPY66_2466 [Firmicutes bacterium]|nr:hypothetical protein [Bacillota bacterium]
MNNQLKEESNLTWAVIGGGNGGQSTAGHLALMGFPVRLYDIIPETVDAIKLQGGIRLEGDVVQGFGKLELATTSIQEAVKGSDIVMVVTPALAHRDIARACAPYLEDGQVVFIHPGATGGALEFRKVLDDEQCSADVTIAEAQSLVYACRSPKPGCANIMGIKKSLMVSALPSTETERVVKLLNTAYEQMYGGANVLQTSLENLNAMMHPGPTLLNTSLIESDRKWKYYYDGITPSIGAFVEEMDRERMAIGEALGIKLRSVLDWYEIMYGVRENTLSETVRKNDAYAQIQGQKALETRYILEDIPMGLVPMLSLARLTGVKADRIETVVKLGQLLLNKDFVKIGRSLENLGLSGMDIEQIHRYLKTGEK